VAGDIFCGRLLAASVDRAGSWQWRKRKRRSWSCS
jgi:hypothetical protein